MKQTVTIDLEAYRKLLIENHQLRRQVTRLNGELRNARRTQNPRPAGSPGS